MADILYWFCHCWIGIWYIVYLLAFPGTLTPSENNDGRTMWNLQFTMGSKIIWCNHFIDWQIWPLVIKSTVWNHTEHMLSSINALNILRLCCKNSQTKIIYVILQKRTQEIPSYITTNIGDILRLIIIIYSARRKIIQIFYNYKSRVWKNDIFKKWNYKLNIQSFIYSSEGTRK